MDSSAESEYTPKEIELAKSVLAPENELEHVYESTLGSNFKYTQLREFLAVKNEYLYNKEEDGLKKIQIMRAHMRRLREEKAALYKQALSSQTDVAKWTDELTQSLAVLNTQEQFTARLRAQIKQLAPQEEIAQQLELHEAVIQLANLRK